MNGTIAISIETLRECIRATRVHERTITRMVKLFRSGELPDVGDIGLLEDVAEGLAITATKLDLERSDAEGQAWVSGL